MLHSLIQFNVLEKQVKKKQVNLFNYIIYLF